MKLRNSIILSMGVLLSGCLTIKTVNISQKTSLEHQLMGSFEPLTEEEMLLSSVRDEAQLVRGPALEEDKNALASRRRQLFNRDDVDRFKQMGCMGEALAGKLVERPCQYLPINERPLLARILDEESTDREAIISWVITQHDHLSEDQRAQVIHIYRRFVLSRSPQETPVETEHGQWSTKDATVLAE